MKQFNLKDFIQLMAFTVNDEPEKVDVIVFIEGDGSSRPEFAADLYERKFARRILVTGETVRRGARRRSRTEPVAQSLAKLGVWRKDILLEQESTNTREQALNILKIAKEKKWKKIMLLVPLYHQPRAYATFIQALNEMEYKVKIVNQHVRGLSWFTKTSHGYRTDLLKIELEKINVYLEKGHVASMREILAYQRWKENL
jgi:uncharacterized SAM-binding protein YcdF (DUF218 family)